MTTLPPLSLYLHLPWCVRKCPYCDFNSHKAEPEPQTSRYLAAVAIDLGAESRHAGDRELISIFIGGGTPSIFSPAEIGELLDMVSNMFSIADDVEVTMEANPGTVECGDPLGYRKAGVNRFSIGAQSFNAESLAILGRIHSVDDIFRSFDAARSAGIDNINLDIMYALPGQNAGRAVFDLETALSLEPEHISWYQLTLEPNTVFHSRPPQDLPGDDQAYAIQVAGQSVLEGAGYEQYEVSAYARDSNRCRHNLNYWSFGDYLAAGAGAHGKVSSGEQIFRYAKTANPLAYMEALEAGINDNDLMPLDEAGRTFEFMLNALRLTDGFDTGLFAKRTGLDPEILAPQLGVLQQKRLIAEVECGFWRVTGLGNRFLNDVQAEFLP